MTMKYYIDDANDIFIMDVENKRIAWIRIKNRHINRRHWFPMPKWYKFYEDQKMIHEITEKEAFVEML